MHRFCVRHMYTNFRKKFKSKELKDLLWSAARAPYVAKLDSWLKKIEEISSEARQWLGDRPTEQWSRASFSVTPQCDMLLNNLCECFNRYILDARDKGIITMFELIRVKLMKRLKAKSDLGNKWKEGWCPKILNILEKSNQSAWLFHATFSGGPRVQVSGAGEQFVVDLEARTCSCRRWQLNGIPCTHAIPAILGQNEDPKNYLANCYNVHTYQQVYQNHIEPINGLDQWPIVPEMVLIIPPEPVKKKKGRKKMLRRKEPEEIEQAAAKRALSRKRRIVIRCRKCGGLNHNIRSCSKSSQVIIYISILFTCT